MEVKNIAIKKYLELDYKFSYDLIFEHIPPENLFNGKICNEKNLTFDEVTVIKKLSANPTIDAMTLLYKVCYEEENFLKCKVIDFFKSKKWLDNMIIALVEREKIMLFSNPDERQIRAGSEKLKKFGTLNTKIKIGQMFGLPPREIGAWKYVDVLHIEAWNVTTGEIQKNLNTMK